jgi:flagellar biosynthesis protein FliR
MEGAWALLLLLLLRVGPLALWTPLGGGATSPAWARGAVAVALAGALWPLAWGAGAPPGEALWALALKEAMLGGALAFLVARVFWAAQGASALAFAGLWGPAEGASRWLPWLSAAVFLGSGGHLVVVEALGRSLAAFPLLQVSVFNEELSSRLALKVAGLGGELFVLVLSLSLPLWASRWLAEVTLGAAQRVGPRWSGLWEGGGLRLWVLVLGLLVAARVLVEVVVEGAAEAARAWPALLGWWW